MSFYLRSIALQDVETQRQGIINVICVEEINNFYQDFIKKSNLSDTQARVTDTIELAEGLPGRTVVEHVCYDHMNTLGVYLFSTMLKFILMAFTPFMKARMQIHTGKGEELLLFLFFLGNASIQHCTLYSYSLCSLRSTPLSSIFS